MRGKSRIDKDHGDCFGRKGSKQMGKWKAKDENTTGGSGDEKSM